MKQVPSMLLAFSLSACSLAQSPPPSSTSMETANTTAAVRSLIVSRPQEGRLGTLTFDKANQGTLVTQGSGAAVEELKKAWKEISEKRKVTWIKTVVEERGGKKVTAIEAEEYTRNEANYFYAVLDTLSRSYGFAVEIAK